MENTKFKLRFKAMIRILVALSVGTASVGGLAAPYNSPITRGGNIIGTGPTAEEIQADITGLGDITTQSSAVNLNLNGIRFRAQEIQSSWAHGVDQYRVVTTAVATNTPAEYQAAMLAVQQGFSAAAGSGHSANLIHVIPDNESGREMQARLAAAFTTQDASHVLTLPLNQVALTNLEKKLAARGGILGKLQKSVRAAAGWLTDRPKWYQTIFVSTRVMLNGTAAATSFLLSYAGIHPAVAIAAGASAGLLSGAIQMFAHKYAKFLVYEGAPTKFMKGLLRKTLPFLSPNTTDSWASQASMLSKYAGLEVIFLGIPIAIFFGSDAYSSVLDSTAWVTSLVGAGFEQFTYNFDLAKVATIVGISVFGQYPWDSTIAKLNEIDLAQAQGDEKQLQWIEFRTKAYFLGISALAVLATAISFGNETLGFSILGVLGSLGLYLGHKAVKRAKAYKATCEEFLTIGRDANNPGYVTIPAPFDKTGS